jgi:hypothetical protein
MESDPAFHASLAFTLMRKEGRGFMGQQNAAQLKHFRHTVVQLVLSTDLAQHAAILNQFSVLAATAGTAPALALPVRGAAPPIRFCILCTAAAQLED